MESSVTELFCNEVLVFGEDFFPLISCCYSQVFFLSQIWYWHKNERRNVKISSTQREEHGKSCIRD